MLKRVLFVIAVLVGGVIGGYGSWVFHYILDANAAFITRNKWLAAIVGSLSLLFVASIVHDTKHGNPRAYGLLVFGIACGIFVQAVFYFTNLCMDDCNTDFVLKLAACVILMVDGFGSYYRRSAQSTSEWATQS